MVVIQIDDDTSECDHRKGPNEIDDKDIVEDLLSKQGWEYLDFDKTKSPTEVRGMNHCENQTACGLGEGGGVIDSGRPVIQILFICRVDRHRCEKLIVQTSTS
jgi:hypothetical protein